MFDGSAGWDYVTSLKFGRILEDLGVSSVRLMTNNPTKIDGLRALGVRVVDRVPVEPTVHPENAGYLHTKVKRMNHLLTLTTRPDAVTLIGRGNGHGRSA